MTGKFLHGVEVIELDSGTRPIQTTASSVIGLIGTASQGPVNKTTLITNITQAIEIFGADTNGYTIPAALAGIFEQTGATVVVVNVADPENENFLDTNDELDPSTIAQTDIVGGTNTNGDYYGAQCFLGSQSECGVCPRILIAPHFTESKTNDAANPTVGALLTIAEKIHALVIADCPDTTKEDAADYAEDFDSSRLFCIYPYCKVLKADSSIALEPLSARVAGIIAKSDNERGFWWSPSNSIINGIVGLSKPIDFNLGDASCAANYLNSKNVATVISQDGFRLWGNRSCSTDLKWQFISVRRTADLINDALLRAHLWAVDRNITKTYCEDVCESVNAYLRYLKNIGAIMGGECWADKSVNTAEQISLGKVMFDFDFTPPYPAEHITFRSHLVNDYLNEIFE